MVTVRSRSANSTPESFRTCSDNQAKKSLRLNLCTSPRTLISFSELSWRRAAAYALARIGPQGCGILEGQVLSGRSTTASAALEALELAHSERLMAAI